MLRDCTCSIFSKASPMHEHAFMSITYHLLLENVSRCSLYFVQMLRCPLNKAQMLQMFWAYIQHTHIYEQMQYSKQKCGIPLSTDVPFLALAKPTQSTIIPLRNVPCPSKRPRVIFQRSNRRIWLKKITIYLLEKQNAQCYCRRAPSQHGNAS